MRCEPNLRSKVPIFEARCTKISRYCHHGSELWWEPVDQCLLPPPQPFWLTATCTCVKSTGMMLIFWTKLDGRRKVWRERLMAVFVFGQSVVSIILLVIKAWTMPGFSSWWEHHECWGIILSAAPWSQNFVLYVFKFMSACDAASQPVDVEASRSWQFKETLYTRMMALIGCAFVAFNGLFTITNLVPAAIIFCFFSLFLFIASAGFLKFWSSVEFCSMTAQVNMIPWAAMPLALVYEFTIQFLAIASVYLYAGQGYFCSLWLTATERRSDIYFVHFRVQILHHAPWLSELINQVFP